MWSLATETLHGVDNRTEAVPLTIDPQYSVGFSWARQYGLRVAKNFGNKVWLAASMENAQATVSSHNNADNFLVGSAGAAGGLYNAADLHLQYELEFLGCAGYDVQPDCELFLQPVP